VADLRDAGRSTLSLQDPIEPDGDAELGSLLADEVPSPHEQAESAVLVEEVHRLLATLDPRERAVLEHRYGLGTADAATRTETARRLGLRRRDVAALEALALRRLGAVPAARALAA